MEQIAMLLHLSERSVETRLVTGRIWLFEALRPNRT
jgi:hypothetical protein